MNNTNQKIQLLITNKDAIGLARMIRSLQFSEPCRTNEFRGISDCGLDDETLYQVMLCLDTHRHDTECRNTLDDIIIYLLREEETS